LDKSDTGSDFNEGMLTLAKQRYPSLQFENEDIRALTMQDESLDIVFSSATIMHLEDYKIGLRELARVCRSWLVLHRLGIVWRKKSSIEIKHHYDVDVYAHHISRDELLQEMNALGYKLVAEEPLSKRTLSRRQSMSLLFKRKKSSPQVLRKG